MKNIERDIVLKNSMISKEDFKKYFNNMQVIKKEKFHEYFNKTNTNKGFKKFPTFSRLSLL